MSVKHKLVYEINLPVVTHEAWLNNGKTEAAEVSELQMQCWLLV